MSNKGGSDISVVEYPHSALWASVHLRRPAEKQTSGFGLLPVAVTKIKSEKLSTK